jgi:hypothetical protein
MSINFQNYLLQITRSLNRGHLFVRHEFFLPIKEFLNE